MHLKSRKFYPEMHIIHKYQLYFKEDKCVFPFTTSQASRAKKVLMIQEQVESFQPVRKSIRKH